MADVLYFPHGGGPLPLLGEPGHADMCAFLQQIARELKRPKTIVLISAHWEEQSVQVNTNASPGLLYDYYGFPEEAYQIEYPLKGDAVLSERVLQLLNDAGLNAKENTERDFDHGVFVPLKIMYPEADIPCVQISLLQNMDAEQHIALGKVLSSLHDEDVLFLGSGSSFHNLRPLANATLEQKNERNAAFHQWLDTSLLDTSLSNEERITRLIHWESQAPFSNYCHPREEHLLPLHVCFGIAQNRPCKAYAIPLMETHTAAYLWQ